MCCEGVSAVWFVHIDCLTPWSSEEKVLKTKIGERNEMKDIRLVNLEILSIVTCSVPFLGSNGHDDRFRGSVSSRKSTQVAAADSEHE